VPICRRKGIARLKLARCITRRAAPFSGLKIRLDTNEYLFSFLQLKQLGSTKICHFQTKTLRRISAAFAPFPQKISPKPETYL